MKTRSQATASVAAAFLVVAPLAAQQKPPAAAPPAASAPPAAAPPPPQPTTAPAAPAPPSPPTAAPAPAPEAPPAAPTAAPPAPPAPPPAPAPAPPAAPPAPAPAAPAAPALPPPGTAQVYLSVDYPGAYLELRDFDTGVWKRVCDAPCNERMLVDGLEARVGAPNMVTSNAFLIAPGAGTARLRVSGGSASSRQIGIIGMASGIPVALAGMGLYGWGKVQDQSGFEIAGIATLAVGGVLILGSLPFLGAGKTSVRDSRGKVIARRSAYPSF